MNSHPDARTFNAIFRDVSFFPILIGVITVALVFFTAAGAGANSPVIENHTFIENDDGMVTDLSTGLIWQKKAPLFGKNWYGASDYCHDLNKGGHSNWRLPDIKTLKDLYGKKEAFPGDIKGSYWSSSEYDWKMGVYNFDDGRLYGNSKSKGRFNILCVRTDSEAWERSSYPLSLLLDWQNAGFSPEKALEWGSLTHDDAPDMLSHFRPSDAIAWKTAGFSPDQAKKWRSAGFDPVTARNWREASFELADARLWRTSGFEPQEAFEWNSSGKGPDEAKEWDRAGFQPFEAATWKESGLDPMSAREWFRSKFTPTAAKSWIEAEFGISEAAKWGEMRFSPTEAKKWQYASFKPNNAAEWRDAGHTLAEAKSWAGFKPDSAMRIKSVCSAGISGWMEMLQSNPYDIAGKCFYVTGSNIQFLGKSAALFMLFREPFYIDFGTKSAPKGVWEGYVKGVGAYEYVDTYGASRAVPKVKALNLDL